MLYNFTLDEPDTKFPGLCVHHKYYVEDQKPWEYDDDVYETLCMDCHKKIHQNHNIPKYEFNNKLKIKNYPPLCPICHGSGYKKDFWFYKNGTCLSCGGEGVMANGFGNLRM